MRSKLISLNRDEIEALIDVSALAPAIEDAYRAASTGAVNLPPVGHITFPDHQADCHIKYGHMLGTDTFVIKIATGFPLNSDLGLVTGNGLVLVLSAVTGQVEAMFHDEMMLTDIRTGIGGAIASRALARADVARVLIVGSGPQAIRQIEAHHALMGRPMTFEMWGRNLGRAEEAASGLAGTCTVTVTRDLEAAVAHAEIIVTATSSSAPLIRSGWVQPGTHITAVGADAPGKQELDPDLVARADVLAVDLAAQCLDHGEVSHAARAGLIEASDVIALGDILNGSAGRTDDAKITLADLTGIAAQDIAIATAVLAAWQQQQD